MKVLKFGGSSLADGDALARVAEIIVSRAQVPLVVVVSAMGKTTDQLLEITESAAAGRRADVIGRVERLEQYHREQARRAVGSDAHPELDAFLGARFHELREIVGGLATLGEVTPRSADAVASFGEVLSSFVVTLALRRQGLRSAQLDAREVIVTDDRFTQASPRFDLTNRRLLQAASSLLAQNDAVVMGGFIAATEEGVTSTLGRGGSDFTASIVGAALDAEEIQIWTDVDGVMTADPSMLPNALRVRVMSFAEASELAYFGARVLHPSTVVPAIENDIPVRVLNSRRPEVEGTRIVSRCPPSLAAVKSIAYKNGITVVDIRSTRMLMAHGYLAKIFEVFDRFETAVDMVSTSEVEVSLTIDRTDRLTEIIEALEKFAEVTFDSAQAIVCLVGDNLRYTSGIAARIFSAVESVNIRMISQGASRLNVSFVIDENDLESAVSSLHEEFFAEVDEMVFV